MFIAVFAVSSSIIPNNANAGCGICKDSIADAWCMYDVCQVLIEGDGQRNCNRFESDPNYSCPPSVEQQ